MRIIEQFICGKAGDDALCEDKIVVTSDFIAVVDGATSRQGLTLGGWSNGRFAAEVIARGLGDFRSDIPAKEAVVALTEYLRREAEAAAVAEGKRFDEIWAWPAAALLVYSQTRKEIWRVADSTFLVDGKANYRSFPQEEIWAALRHAYLVSRMARGETEAAFLERDPSWDLLTPIISEFKIFANHDGEFGYGVINGSAVPDAHIEVFPVPDAHEIVLASDGYPEVFATLAETEAQLSRVLREDPLMHRIHPQVKGIKKGHLSFDDRSYIRFTPA